MPNGMDCCCLLQTEPHVVPTQWLVYDCTADGRWKEKFADRSIDYAWAREGAYPVPSDDGSVAVKRSFIDIRRKATAALFSTYHNRRNLGSAGRLVIWFIGDLADPLGSLLLAELPLDVSNGIFWETNLAPAVIRVGVGSGAEKRRDFLSTVQDQYFAMPVFADPYYGKYAPGQLYGNEFDSTLLTPDDLPLHNAVDHLVRLHIAETWVATQQVSSPGHGGFMIIERVMQHSARWRRIDWLAVTDYVHFPRLWDMEHSDILDVLDYTRCPERTKDPWAALKNRSREKDWGQLNLPQQTQDLMLLEQPYRISPGDIRSLRALAQFLLRHGQHTDVLLQCDLAKKDVEYDADPLWLKIEGLARDGLGEKQEARALFGRYRERLVSQPEVTARTFDEIGALALVEGEWKLAVDSAQKAIEKDGSLLHAYDILVLTARASNTPEYEEQAKALAAKNGVKIPIHMREATQQTLASSRVVATAAKSNKKWWKFWT